MKRKIILGVTTIIVALCAVGRVNADTEEAGGKKDGECLSPYTNTCMIIHVPILGERKIEGVLTIRP